MRNQKSGVELVKEFEQAIRDHYEGSYEDQHSHILKLQKLRKDLIEICDASYED